MTRLPIWMWRNNLKQKIFAHDHPMTSRNIVYMDWKRINIQSEGKKRQGEKNQLTNSMSMSLSMTSPSVKDSRDDSHSRHENKGFPSAATDSCERRLQNGSDHDRNNHQRGWRKVVRNFTPSYASLFLLFLCKPFASQIRQILFWLYPPLNPAGSPSLWGLALSQYCCIICLTTAHGCTTFPFWSSLSMSFCSISSCWSRSYAILFTRRFGLQWYAIQRSRCSWVLFRWGWRRLWICLFSFASQLGELGRSDS